MGNLETRALALVPEAVTSGPNAIDEAAALAVRTAVDDMKDLAGAIEELDATAPGVEHSVVGWLGVGRNVNEHLEAERVRLTRPLDQRKKSIDAFFRGLRSAVDEITGAAEAKLREWRKVERERREAEERARLEAERKAREERELAELEAEERRRQAEADALAAADSGDEEKFASASAIALAGRPAPPVVVVAPAPALPPLMGATTAYGSGKVVDVLDFEVVDAWAVPRHLVKDPQVDRRLALAEIKRLAGPTAPGATPKVPEVAGLRVFVVEDVAFRKAR